jgi:hypothetical protein
MDDMQRKVVAVEYDGNRLVQRWMVEKQSRTPTASAQFSGQKHAHLHWLHRGFLPEGFPNSVTPDYLGKYQNHTITFTKGLRPRSSSCILLDAHGAQAFSCGTPYRLCALT